MNLYDRDLIWNTRKEALQQKAVEDAKKALEMNLSIEQAAEITGLSVEQVLKLK